MGRRTAAESVELYRRELEGLSELVAFSNDPERAHKTEDALLWRFVREVSTGLVNTQAASEVAAMLADWDQANADRTRYCA